MYPVSEAFLSAVQENTRRYYWTGKITTKAGVVHEFTEEDIVKGSGYISSQCCGSTEMELGTVYAAEMGITLFLDVDRYTLEDANELDITSAESKATYQEIKDYVLKEFGLKVSTLYISQIKRKCDIDVGEHYNISQKENQKVPQCPKEKEDAIRVALEHFVMI